MKVSLNTAKSFTDIDVAVPVLVDKINAQLGGVEEVIDLESTYRGAVIVRVVTCEKHPNADRLSVCKVDDGNAVDGLERDEDGYVQVVCGAPNVHADMFAIWLPPHTTVPASVGTDEPFVLGSRELRGVVSNGMLAAADELGIGTDHEGIVELTDADVPPHIETRALASGQDFAELFGLDDQVIDIENKMFTHRPDCFGQIGVARELAGISHQQFTSPEWYISSPTFATATGLGLTLNNEATDVVPRFMVVAYNNVVIKPSPFWLQCELVRLGSKPINNVVDVTNYVMLMTGQPMHAYDYDKVGTQIGARRATKGEKISLLNGKSYTLDETDVVIVDNEKPIGLGGIMGGGESEVSNDTKNIILECANFDMYTLRKTSMKYGLFTDAVTRYNKGQSSLQQPYVLGYAMSLLEQLVGCVQASDVLDQTGDLAAPTVLDVSVEFVNQRLGLNLAADDMAVLLSNVEIETTAANGSLRVTVPYWRTDLEIPEDIVEEIGRLYGFDNIPLELPSRVIVPAPRNQLRLTKQGLRNAMSAMGANEVLSYSFVHESLLIGAQQQPEYAYKLSNALSPDLQYFRLSVLPSLLDKVHMNTKAGYDEFMLYEIGKAHYKDELDDEGLPREFERMAAVYSSRHDKQGAAYYHMRQTVSRLVREVRGRSAMYVPLETYDMSGHPVFEQAVLPFDAARAAVVMIGGEPCGVVGELKQSVRTKFKMPAYSAAFELYVSAMLPRDDDAQSRYEPLSRYPSISQDVTIKTTADVTYETIMMTIYHALVERAGESIDVKITPVTIYQSIEDTSHKATTLHMVYTSHESTLTDADIKPFVDHAVAVALREFGGERG